MNNTILKHARIAAGLKQSYVAERLGVSRGCMLNWERGVNDVPLSKALQMSKLYGIDINTLAQNMQGGGNDEN